jgi:hypothetical protein
LYVFEFYRILYVFLKFIQIPGIVTENEKKIKKMCTVLSRLGTVGLARCPRRSQAAQAHGQLKVSKRGGGVIGN